LPPSFPAAALTGDWLMPTTLKKQTPAGGAGRGGYGADERAYRRRLGSPAGFAYPHKATVAARLNGRLKKQDLY
jgi:hypothetical protein